MGGEYGERILIGQIVRPHGIRGEVKIVSKMTWPDGFEIRGTLFLACRDQNYSIAGGRWYDDYAILRLSGVSDRDEAEALRGCEVLVNKDQMPELPEEHYYETELIGLKVRTVSGKPVGTLKEVLHMPAQDVYEISTPSGSVLIPAVESFIKKIDLDNREMIVEPIEGLLDSDAD